MPTVTVETGAGLSNSNSFITVAEGTTHASTNLYMTAWDQASTSEKEIAVILATRLICRHTPWKGSAAVVGQALAWPRIGCYDRNGFLISSSTIPTLLKEATAEMANAILAEERTADQETGLASANLGSLAVAFDKYDRAGVLPNEVKACLAPVADFGGGFAVRLQRV